MKEIWLKLVVNRKKDFVDGICRTFEDSVNCSATIRQITVKGTDIYIHTSNTIEKGPQKWKRSNVETFLRIDTLTFPDPINMGHGKVHFDIPKLGHATLIPMMESYQAPARSRIWEKHRKKRKTSRPRR